MLLGRRWEHKAVGSRMLHNSSSLLSVTRREKNGVRAGQWNGETVPAEEDCCDRVPENCTSFCVPTQTQRSARSSGVSTTALPA